MPRPIWAGHLSFGLVAIPVTLFSAEEPLKEIDFDMLDARDGSRVRYKRFNEVTGKEVPWKSIAKGVKRGSDYITVTPEDFARAAQDIVRGVEIVAFVKADAISPLLFEKPYYLAPGKGGEKAYVLLRQTLANVQEIGIAKLVIRTRQHMAALMVVDELLALVTLRFAEEVRAPRDIVDTARLARVKVAPQERDMARQLVTSLSGEWNPNEFHDEYRDALQRIIAQKSRAGGGHAAPEAPTEAPPAPETQDIVALLRQSIAGGGRPSPRPPRRVAKSLKRMHGRRKAA